MSDYRGVGLQRFHVGLSRCWIREVPCRIIEVLEYRGSMLDYRGVGLERFHVGL